MSADKQHIELQKEMGPNWFASFQWASIILFIFLILAWFTAALGTFKGFRHGQIFQNPTSVVYIKSKKDDS